MTSSASSEIQLLEYWREEERVGGREGWREGGKKEGKESNRVNKYLSRYCLTQQKMTSFKP